MPKKVKLGLRGLDLKLKIETARKIIASMENNYRFPEPDPALNEIEQAVTMLEHKYSDVLNEKQILQMKTSELSSMESDLDKKITLLASYVESKAKGDIDAIHSAGMEVRADSVPVGIPERTIIKSLRETDAYGAIKIFWGKVKGAKFYNIECSENADSHWKLYDSTTKTKILITKLKSGTKYWFRVQAIGSAGKGQYSDPAVKYAP
jgi:hypothetical protein